MNEWQILAYYGRNELETLMASSQASDWVKLSERVMGKAPDQRALGHTN